MFQVLDKGPANTQNAVLQILHCLVHYVDITALPSPCIHDLLRVVAKYIEVNNEHVVRFCPFPHFRCAKF